MPTQSPARGIHNVVLRNGKVLLIAGSGNDETAFAAGTFTTRCSTRRPAPSRTSRPRPTCSAPGHVQLRDGRVLVMGGNKDYPVPGGHGYQGLRVSYIFDPATNTYTRTNDMNAGHWYPSATVLGNGDVLSLGGLGEDSAGTVSTEYWSSAQNRWLGLNEVQADLRVLGAVPGDGADAGRAAVLHRQPHLRQRAARHRRVDLQLQRGHTITDVPGLRDKDNRDQSASVLLPPAQDQRVLTIGGGNVETNPDANRLVDLIDLKAAEPEVRGRAAAAAGHELRAAAPQTGAQGKMYVSAVILPDGKVFETGGALHNRADAVAEASMFDPQTNTFTAGMATDPVPARLPLQRRAAARRAGADRRQQPGRRLLRQPAVDLLAAVPVQGRPAGDQHGGQPRTGPTAAPSRSR